MKTLIDLYYFIKWYLSNEFLFLPYKIPTIFVKYLILEDHILKDKKILDNWDIIYWRIKKSELKNISDKKNRKNLKWEKYNPILSLTLPIILEKNKLNIFLETAKLFSINWNWNHRLLCAYENNIKWIWCVIWPHKVDFYSKSELKFLINEYLNMFWKNDIFFDNKKILIVNKYNSKEWIKSFKKENQIDNEQYWTLIYYDDSNTISKEKYLEKTFIDFN